MKGSHVHRQTFRFFSSCPSAIRRFAFRSAEHLPAPASRIYLDVVVTPKSGPPVANLQQQDFIIFDNKTQQHVTSFQAFSGSQDPIHVILVIDAVNSSYQSIAYQRGEIDKFLRANGGRLAEPMALAFFTDTGTQIQQGFSTDGNALSASLDQYSIGLRNIRRSSQYGGSDRLQLSMNALREIAAQEANLPGRKLIFWMSPGWPLLSGPGIELDSKQQNQIFATIVNFSTQLRQARTTLYSIDPLGSSEGLGRTFYYQEFCEGRQQGEPGYAGRPQPAGVGHANRRSGPQLQQRRSLRSSSNAWRTPRPTTGCPLIQLLPTIATSITVSKSS